jgi:hypothetical protein
VRIEGTGLHGRRHERLKVNAPARAVSKSRDQTVVVEDISESGVAISAEADIYSNDQFVELQMEGYDRLAGRVVRKLAGGYALQFDEDEETRARMAEEIEKFRKLSGPNNYMEG